jgi:hypothetical protein
MLLWQAYCIVGSYLPQQSSLNRPKQTSLNFPPPPRLSVFGEGWESVQNIQGYYCSTELGASRSPRHISKYWFAQLRSLPSSFGKEKWHVNLLPYLPIPSLHQCESPKAQLKIHMWHFWKLCIYCYVSEVKRADSPKAKLRNHILWHLQMPCMHMLLINMFTKLKQYLGEPTLERLISPPPPRDSNTYVLISLWGI